MSHLLRNSYNRAMVEDVVRWNNEQHVILQVMVIFCIHDFPAYGLIAGCVTKGYKGCPTCGAWSESRKSEVLGKNIYKNQARMYLDAAHEMQLTKQDLHGHCEFEKCLDRISRDDVIAFAKAKQDWLDASHMPCSEGDPVYEHEIKRLSILFRLRYWMLSNIINCITKCYTYCMFLVHKIFSICMSLCTWVHC